MLRRKNVGLPTETCHCESLWVTCSQIDHRGSSCSDGVHLRVNLVFGLIHFVLPPCLRCLNIRERCCLTQVLSTHTFIILQQHVSFHTSECRFCLHYFLIIHLAPIQRFFKSLFQNLVLIWISHTSLQNPTDVSVPQDAEILSISRALELELFQSHIKKRSNSVTSRVQTKEKPKENNFKHTIWTLVNNSKKYNCYAQVKNDPTSM